MINHSCQPGRHPDSERELDLYETPEVAVEALLRVESLPPCVWEPSAGRGAIVGVLRSHGHTVIASDIHDYGFPLDFCRNFLAETKAPARCDAVAVVTNPPYKYAQDFVAHALTLVPTVIMLLRLAFLESTKRTAVLEKSGLARVHVFRERLPMMHRDGWTGKRATSAIPFAWFVWNRDHVGPATLNRISWKNSHR
jgi:hypothetical protein